MEQKLKPFLDQQGRLKQLPSKNNIRREAYLYLSSKFQADKKYTEKEVNQILTEWNTFGDYFILRRGLVECCLLDRTPDGSQYWKLQSTEVEIKE